METRDLGYVLAVEEHGGVGKAAEALGMSQPALTKAIQRVEAQAGLVLFQRTANGVAPTQAGSLFLARARRIAPQRPTPCPYSRQASLRALPLASSRSASPRRAPDRRRQRCCTLRYPQTS